jgi:hypothetical protein
VNATDPSAPGPWKVVGFFVGDGVDLAARRYNNGGHPPKRAPWLHLGVWFRRKGDYTDGAIE